MKLHTRKSLYCHQQQKETKKEEHKMKDKKHFLRQHHESATTAAAVSSPSSSSPPLYPSLHDNTNPTDGATVELPRRLRGRPTGSKNKPKAPSSSIVAPSPSPASPSLSPNSIPHPLPSMRTLLLQIDPDNDIVDSVTRFCRNNSVSLSILSASGTLSHFTLRHPSSPPSNLTFRGRFDILSISATIVPPESGGPSESRSNPSSFYLPSGFTVTVSGPQGQVVGGAVGGPLIAAGQVFIVAASFDKPTYHRLPEFNEDEEDNDEKRQSAGGGIFGCNLGGSDAVWGPVSARPPY